MAWTTPKTDWAPDTAISHTLLNNVGNNLVDLNDRVGEGALGEEYIATMIRISAADITSNPFVIGGWRFFNPTLTNMPTIIHLCLKQTTGTGGGSGLLRTSQGLDSRIWPNTIQYIPCFCIDQDYSPDYHLGYACISTTGSIEFFKASGVLFSNGTIGIADMVLTYPKFP